MTWLKLDDAMYSNPKILNLKHDTFRVHIGGLLHSASTLTDGLITTPALYSLVLPKMRKPETLAAELVQVSLWKCNGDESWSINDYLEYNPSRAKVLADRAKDAARKKASYATVAHLDKRAESA